MLTAKEIAAAAVKALDSKKGQDLKLIEISDVSSLADYFLICTATSSTHVKSLCDAVEEAMDKAEEPLLNREGHRGGSWVLMDFGCLVVHVFTEEARAFYDLERSVAGWTRRQSFGPYRRGKRIIALTNAQILITISKKYFEYSNDGKKAEERIFREPAAAASRRARPLYWPRSFSA
jgi:ribosome-associated protein